MMNRILTIIDKEWIEVFKNRAVLFTVLFMPVVFTVLPLVILSAMRMDGDLNRDMVDMPVMFARNCGDLQPGECLQYFMLNQFMILFMILPASIPVSIAAYSIAGEKTSHSLEPLLATPITTIELMLAKCLAAAIPAVAATWLCFAFFLALLPFIGMAKAVIDMAAGIWLIAVGVIGPLIAIQAVMLALIVSTRVNDPRTAQQISMVVILPIMVFIFGQVGGWLIINRSLMWTCALVMLIIDLALVFISADLFERETILTRWK
jgi:ABC-2 type transport system permease protein